MAKSVQTGDGDNRGRRVSARRRKSGEQVAAEPPQVTARDVRASFEALPKSRSGGGPTREDIARRAYELYLRRGGTHGYDIEDWLEAERELTAK